jgi:hypothetical protein
MREKILFFTHFSKNKMYSCRKLCTQNEWDMRFRSNDHGAGAVEKMLASGMSLEEFWRKATFSVADFGIQAPGYVMANGSITHPKQLIEVKIIEQNVFA